MINEGVTEQLYDLASLAVDQNLDQDCGPIAFKLVDEAHADIVSVTPEGLVSIRAMTDETLVGSHQI